MLLLLMFKSAHGLIFYLKISSDAVHSNMHISYKILLSLSLHIYKIHCSLFVCRLQIEKDFHFFIGAFC